MGDRFERMMDKLDGGGSVEKHILLLKLSETLNNVPELGSKPTMEPNTPQRLWLAQAGALVKRLGVHHTVRFNTSFGMLRQYWAHATSQIMGQLMDAIEEIKLDLELDGRSEIGTAYPPGDTYKFFADLKGIINAATNSVIIIDPYFNGAAFDAYLGSLDANVEVKILADRYSTDIRRYVDRHQAQFQTVIHLRRSAELHDRLIIVDDDTAWIMGGSIKDAGKKATYLIPLQPQLASAKKRIYDDIWSRASQV